MTPSEQIKFCKLLKYFQKGDYSLFKKACDLSGVTLLEDPFYYSNQFLAFQIGGLIEASAIESSTRWSVSFEGNFEVESDISKIIGVDSNFFENKENSRPLIKSESGTGLLFGVDSNVCNKHSFFGKAIFSKIPSARSIEEEVLAEEKSFFSKDNNFELFELSTLAWKALSANEGKAKGIVRIRKRFGGVEYFIVHEEVNLAFRVLHPEWMFVLGSSIFKWDLSKTIKIENSDIVIPRQFRFPNLYYKIFFANSKACLIGKNVRFIEAQKPLLDWTKNSLIEGRVDVF